MGKRIYILLILLVAFIMPSHAVFDEKNIDQSLHVLNYELKDRYVNIGKQNQLQRDRTKARAEMMNEARKHSHIIAMMLYSQKAEYIFGLTYACDMAIDLYDSFVEKMNPLVVQERINSNDVVRYDSLIMVLNRINPANLSPTAKNERMECIYWANMIKAITAKRDLQTKKSIADFYNTKRFLANLNIYAEKRYKDVQEKIFKNGSETFYHILENWDERWPYLKMVTTDEYKAGDEVPSDWGVSIRKNLFISFAIGVLLAIFLGWVIAFLLKRYNPLRGPKVWKSFILYIKEWLDESRTCFIVTIGTIIFAIALDIILFLTDQNFLEMALGLMSASAWVIATILLSSFFMKAGKDVKHTMLLYIPALLCGTFVIFLRVNLLANLVVAFALPPVILVCALWEAWTLYKVWKEVGKVDRVLASITEVLFSVLVIFSWNGFILLTVQVLIWWMMQLAFILILTSIGAYTRVYGINHDIHNQPIKNSWLYYFICKLLCPVGALYSFLLSAYWGGEVFSLGDTVTQILGADIAGSTNVTISLWLIIRIVVLWFIARFIYFIAEQAIMKGYSKNSITFEQGQNMMYTKVVQIFVYGVWFIIVMYMLHISMTWITAAWAGLLTGLGFASKTILENIFYGISLLSGRLKIGDLIKVGDVYGNVLNISYSSTVIRNDDGTVVTFTNSQLMEMNYRNLTHIDEFNKELLYINVSLKTDMEEFRRVVLEATATLPCLHLKDEVVDGKPKYKVGVRSVGLLSWELATAIRMEVAYWVDPVTEKRDIGIVTECIINALRDNNIEIL